MSAEPNVIENEPNATPAAEPAATPAATPVSTPAAANWRDSLPVDLRDNPTLANIPDVESLAKEHIGVQKMIGADKIVIPGEDATPAEWSTFHGKLGRPDKAEDYDLSGVEVPEGLPWDGEFQTSMVSKMHELGLNPRQVQGVLDYYISNASDKHEQSSGDMMRAQEAGEKELRNSWGKSFDAHKDLAKRAFMSATGENYEAVAGLKMADGGMLGDHPDVVRAFAELGGKMSEHGLVGATAQRTTLSPGESKTEVNRLMGDEAFIKVYTDKEHPEHESSIQRMQNLIISQVGDDE